MDYPTLRYRVPPPSAPALLGQVLGAVDLVLQIPPALAGTIALQRGLAPPTAGFERADASLLLSAEPRAFEKEFVLVNAFSCDGNNASLVLRRWVA